MVSTGKKPTFFELLLQHAIVFLICVVFPGVTTLFAPASWLSFHRSGDAVDCTARTCVFFVVPYKVQTIQNVSHVDSRQRDGRTEKKRKFGKTTTENVYVDGEGFLQVHGQDGKSIEVSVSPASLDRVVEKSNNFLTASQEPSLMMFTIANWKFGAIMGGVLTSFTALYVVGYSLGLLKFLFTRGTRWLTPDSNKFA